MPEAAVLAASAEIRIRPARNDDAQDLFGLLALCFADYPGCYVDPHADLTDLRAPGTAFSERGGAFFVVEDESVCGCIAVDCPKPGVGELHRLYVRPDRRGKGIGGMLIAHAEDHARRLRATQMVFWSDTRFTTAHRLYDRHGYKRVGGTRELGDISNSVEYRFEKRF
jgi:putative acetyltransferase